MSAVPPNDAAPVVNNGTFAYIRETVSNAGTAVLNAPSNAVAYVKDLFTAHDLGICATTAFAGSGLAINSTVNLIKDRKQVNLSKEITKIAAGTGLVALSVYGVSEQSDKLTVGLVAAAAGLATALLRAATDVPFNVRSFVLKKIDGEGQGQVKARIQGVSTPDGSLKVASVRVYSTQEAA